MAMNIGGFFATLSLKTDQSSIDKSLKNMDELHDKIKKVGIGFTSFVGDALKGLTAIGGAAVGAAYAVSQIQGKMAVTATGAGMQFSELNKWSVAMGLVGGNVEDLVAKLTSFEDTLSGLAIGRKGAEFTKLAEDLAIFGQVDINKFKALSQTGRMELVANMVTSQTNPEKRKAMEFAAGDMFGASFLKMLQTFRTSGSQYTNIGQLLSRAGASASGQNGSAGLANEQAFNRAGMDIDQTFKLLGQTLATTLRPIINDFSKMLEENYPKIKFAFEQIGNGLKAFFDTIKPFTDWASSRINATTVGAMYNNVAGNTGMHEIIAAVAKKYGMFSPGSDEEKNAQGVAFWQGRGSEYADRMAKVQQEAMGIYDKSGSLQKPGVTLYVNVDKSGNVSVSDKASPGGTPFRLADSGTGFVSSGLTGTK